MGINVLRAASLGLVVMLSSNCGSSATITLQNGRLAEGQIIAGDRNSIYLDTGEAELTVPRDRIADVDHPGNGAAITGILLTAYGALNIAVGLPKCDKEGTAFCMGVFTPAVLGLGLTGYGFSVWGASRNAMHRDVRGRELSRTFVSPTYVYSGENKGPGLLLVSTF
jgi:hypothetical protein